MAEQAIRPEYATERPNAQVDLYNGNLELRAPNLIFGAGDVSFLWQPYMRMRFRLDPVVVTDPRTLSSLDERHAILNIPTTPSINYDAYITDKSINVIAAGPITIKLGGTCINNRQIEADCDEMKFHIANMRDCIGGNITYSDHSSIYSRRISLSDDEWETTIDGVENIKELLESLRQDGGFAITHIGVLRRKGGMPFKADEALKQIKTLGFFLSFVVGRWCCPVLLVGTRNGEIVFRDLSGNTRIDPWKGNWQWCSSMDARYLDVAYKGFISKWKDPRWREPIAKIIEFYVRANTYPTVELSVLDSFTALDVLASAYSLETINPASKRIRKILEKGALNARTPPEALHTLYKSFYAINCPSKIADSASILADFRHGVVHGNYYATKADDIRNRPKLDDDGDPNNPPVPFETKREAKELGLWCVEMSLLCLFKYNGHYNDRLTREQDIQSPQWPS